MRALLLIAGALVALTSCTSKADKLQQQYEMMQRTGATPPELCVQSKKVVAAYLEAGDEENYTSRKLSSDIECASHQLERRANAGLNR